MDDEEDMINNGEDPIAGPSNTQEGGDAPLSKKAIKRAARQAKLAEAKPEKRKAEKLRRKENAQKLYEAEKAGTLTPEQQSVLEARLHSKIIRARAKRRENRGDVPDWKGGVVIDLDFDHLMTDQEIKSMASQIGYVYSANRLAERPFSSILHTSFNETQSPRLWEQMLKTKREVWGRCHWTGAGIDRLAQKFGSSSTSQTPVEGDELELPETISPETHSLVYLSADAEEELDTLKENEIYIIGGIVDKNRHKFLCQNKADKYGMRTARLPIGTYLANMPTRKVLTVNQVFSILVEFITRNSWSEAFEAVIPQRKYHDGKKKRRKAENGSASPGMQEDESDDEDGDEEMDETALEELEMSRMEEEGKDVVEEVQANV